MTHHPPFAPLYQFGHVKPNVATIIGAPLINGKALGKALEKKYTELKRAS